MLAREKTTAADPFVEKDDLGISGLVTGLACDLFNAFEERFFKFKNWSQDEIA